MRAVTLVTALAVMAGPALAAGGFPHAMRGVWADSSSLCRGFKGELGPGAFKNGHEWFRISSQVVGGTVNGTFVRMYGAKAEAVDPTNSNIVCVFNLRPDGRLGERVGDAQASATLIRCR